MVSLLEKGYWPDRKCSTFFYLSYSKSEAPPIPRATCCYWSGNFGKRRLKFDLVMYYKIFHGIVSLDISGFFKVSPNLHHTRGHDYKIIKAPYVNSVSDNLFSTRCVDCWNDLPLEFVNLDSVFSFKKKIDCFNLIPYLSGRPNWSLFI